MGSWAIMALNGVLFVGCCFLVANIMTQVAGEVIEPIAAPTGIAAVDSDATQGLAAAPRVILERNLFGAQLAGDAAEIEQRDEPLTKTKLPLRLLGTAAASQEERSRAAIENQKTKKHIVVAVGDPIDGFKDVSVERIERTRVVLDNRGKPEELQLNDDQPVAARRSRVGRQARARKLPTENSIRDRLKELSNNGGQTLTSLLSQARISPHYEDGEIQGMRVEAIKKGSLFETAGLKDGDVITEVNGIIIDRQEATPVVLEQLLKSDSIEIAADRGGASIRLSAEAADLIQPN